MLEKNNIETIVKEFFSKLTFSVEINLSFKDKTVYVFVSSPEAKFLIGERGEVLSDIQHILKLVLRKKLKNTNIIYIDLDIDNYKKKKAEFLKTVIGTLADEVVRSRKEKILPPMPPYERRVVHTELSKRKDVFTESFGEEPERRVIIKPVV